MGHVRTIGVSVALASFLVVGLWTTRIGLELRAQVSVAAQFDLFRNARGNDRLAIGRKIGPWLSTAASDPRKPLGVDDVERMMGPADGKAEEGPKTRLVYGLLAPHAARVAELRLEFRSSRLVDVGYSSYIE